MHNLIEPHSLVRHFLAHPPEGFPAFELEGVPAFSTRFDLLTTMEPADRRKLERLPLYKTWSRWLRPWTCFIGATVSEYALFPPSQSAVEFVQSVLAQQKEHSFLIIKDIPSDPVLVGEQAHQYSTHLAEAAQRAGFVLVEGQALAYVPIDFPSVEAFMERFSKSRRKDFRRKLRILPELDIEVVETGDVFFDDETMLARFYKLYCEVYDQSEIHFDLLSAEFFASVLRDASSGGRVFVYLLKGELIGYNLCFVESGVLVDKYVGFSYPKARDYNLYVVSWFQNLQYALDHGLKYYVAGWTDPEIKRYLGAQFTFTRHAVYIRNPLVRNLLKPFKRFFEADNNWNEAQDS